MSRKTSVRLPDDLDVKLADYRTKFGGSQSDIIKQGLGVLLDSAPAPKQLETLANRCEKLRQDLARVGGNLNQTAHYFNIHDELKEDELAKNHFELREEFKEIINFLKQVLDSVNSKCI